MEEKLDNYMKLFEQHQVREAITYAQEHPDNLALHLHFVAFSWSPRCFYLDVQMGKPIAHLFCQSVDSLSDIARDAGVNKIYIHRRDTLYQHIDLCGKPLVYVMEQMGEDVKHYSIHEYQSRRKRSWT